MAGWLFSLYFMANTSPSPKAIDSHLPKDPSVDAIPRLDRTKELLIPEKMAAEILRCDSRQPRRANRYSSEGAREGHEARPNVAVDVLFRRGLSVPRSFSKSQRLLANTWPSSGRT